jgi:N-methylhydantoinase A
MRYRVGIDVGGTFTDLLAVRTDGSIARDKTLSTPKDFSLGILDGLANLAQGEGMTVEEFLSSVDLLVHGTTVATNTVLTGTGARTGLLATRGFRDALAMRRGVKERIYDNRYPPPPSLVDRYLRLPVAERTLYDGTVVQELEEDDVLQACEAFREAGVEAVAICFLNAYANGANETAAGKIVESILAESFVSVSHELLPRIGFYDRVSTTVLNAYAGPTVGRYLRALAARLDRSGFSAPLLVMLSSGGVAAAEVAAGTPVAAIRSGPAGAAIAATAYRDVCPRTVTFDMGGTSLDIAIVVDGQIGRVQSADFNRYRVALPMVDLVSIGAGGGSIAWLDPAGLLRVGPGSAGADPGPACYGRGGHDPTVTDADLILGYINEAGLLGGRIPLDRPAAERALRTRIGEPLGMDVEEAAAAVYEVVNVNMGSAVREFLHERGHDPREFALVVAGGAGPVHATAIARELGIELIVVPRDSALLTAVGLLRADLKHDFVQTAFYFLDQVDVAGLHGVYDSLVVRGKAILEEEGVPPAEHRYVFSADLRYERQINEIEVPLQEEDLRAGRFQALAGAFHRAHQDLYGYRLEASRIEFVSARVSAVGLTPSLSLPELPPAAGVTPHSRRAVLMEGLERGAVGVFAADDMGSGGHVEGPAIVEGQSLSLVVPSGCRVDVDLWGNYLVRVDRSAAATDAPPVSGSS